MKSLGALVLPVALAALACGKSRALPGDAGAGVGSGRGGMPAVTGAGGATGTGGGVGPAGTAGSAAGATGSAGAAAGSDGTGGTAGDGAAGRGGAGGTAGAGAAGRGGAGGGAAGAPGTDGGADVAPACTSGDTRCDASGRRLRCAADGTWADDNYVCTMALSGSSDYNTMCALKADGRLACWAAGDWANGQAAMLVTHAPAGTWRQISVGDDAFTMCGIAASGTISCWDNQGGIAPGAPRPSTATFEALSYSIYGTCALAVGGTPTCFVNLPLPSDFTGRFKQIATANGLVYGIDDNGGLHVPSFVLPSYPAGKYKQMTANNNASCAVREDGAIFCDPVSGMLPPPADRAFVEVAATYGNFNACAIRTDGTLTCWLGLATMPPLGPTPAGTFTHIAGCEGAMCGIRTDGTTVCWQETGFEPLVPPAGW